MSEQLKDLETKKIKIESRMELLEQQFQENYAIDLKNINLDEYIKDIKLEEKKYEEENKKLNLELGDLENKISLSL